MKERTIDELLGLIENPDDSIPSNEIILTVIGSEKVEGGAFFNDRYKVDMNSTLDVDKYINGSDEIAKTEKLLERATAIFTAKHGFKPDTVKYAVKAISGAPLCWFREIK